MQVQNASVVIDCRGIWILRGRKQLIGFLLKLLDRDFSAGVGLQLCVELIVLLHAGFAGQACRDSGTEFLKVHTYPVERNAASAVGTFDSRQCFTSASRRSVVACKEV